MAKPKSTWKGPRIVTARPPKRVSMTVSRHRPTVITPTDNTPDLPALTAEEARICEKARAGLAMWKKTFEFWVDIARALKVLRDKAKKIGGQATFDFLREREGFGKTVIAGSRVTRLLAILAQLKEVEAWRKTLTDAQRWEWASPESIVNHFPPLKPKPRVTADGGEGAEPKLSPSAQLRSARVENVDLARMVERLERELADANADYTVLRARFDAQASELERLQEVNGGLCIQVATLEQRLVEQKELYEGRLEAFRGAIEPIQGLQPLPPGELQRIVTGPAAEVDLTLERQPITQAQIAALLRKPNRRGRKPRASTSPKGNAQRKRAGAGGGDLAGTDGAEAS